MKTGRQPEEQTAKQLAEKLKKITENLHSELVRAQMMHQEQVDKRHAFNMIQAVWKFGALF